MWEIYRFEKIYLLQIEKDYFFVMDSLLTMRDSINVSLGDYF